MTPLSRQKISHLIKACRTAGNIDSWHGACAPWARLIGNAALAIFGGDDERLWSHFFMSALVKTSKI